MRSMAWRRRSRTCCPGSSTCPFQEHAAGRWPVGGGFFELAPVGTEGREMAWQGGRRAMRWRTPCRTRSTNWTTTPGWCSSTPRTRPTWDNYLRSLANYLQPRALQGSAFSDFYLRFFASPAGHRQAGGLFEDTTVTRLPWRGQVRRVRMVVHRRTSAASWRVPARPVARAGADHDLRPPRRRAGECRREGSASRRRDIHAWLLRWFNPNPTFCSAPLPKTGNGLRADPATRRAGEGEIELASGTDFAQRLLFFGQPRSDVPNGLWFFDGMPHRVIVMDRLRIAARDGPSDGRDAQGRRCHERAVRPDARGHGDVPDGGRHAPGRAGGAPQPPARKSVGETPARSRPART